MAQLFTPSSNDLLSMLSAADRNFEAARQHSMNKNLVTQDPYGELIGFGADAEDRADQEIGFGWDPDTIGHMTTSNRDQAAVYVAGNWRIRRRLPLLTAYAYANRARLCLVWAV